MKLASQRNGHPDGALLIVDKRLQRAVAADNIVRSLREAVEQWDDVVSDLQSRYEQLNAGGVPDTIPFEPESLMAPMPRAFQWLDGSAYLTHVERVRKARGADMPPSFLTDPLMYQGNSSDFAGPRDPIVVADEAWGIDFEAEVAVVTDDVPKGVDSQLASRHIRLLMLVNDVSLRNLIPAELAKGFGFLHGKPGCTFGPVAITPDELGSHWDGYRVSLPMQVHWNDTQFGKANSGSDMHFDFGQLIAHAARTRRLPTGTIVGSGTISNADASQGYSCIVERRVVEQLEGGQARTPFMRYGDRIRIEMCDAAGQTVFGAIDQTVEPCKT